MPQPWQCLAVAWAAGAALLAGCDHTRREEPAEPEKAEEFSLVVTRKDGTTFKFEDHSITCEPNFHVGASPTGGIIEISTPFESIDLAKPYFAIDVVVADVEGGATYRVGKDTSFAFDEDNPSGLAMFIADSELEQPFFVVDNPLSKGTIKVRSATCSPEPAIDLEISATLAHEFGVEPGVKVVGQVEMGR